MWAQILVTILGLWLMASPAVLPHSKQAENTAHIAGPLAVTFAVTACWEVTRGLRWCNVLIAAWLLLAPWLLGYLGSSASANQILIALLFVVLAQVQGRRKHQFGGGWTVLWRSAGREKGQTR